MYKLFILDFDGTMADTNKIITDSMQTTLHEAGLPMRSREECSKTIGLPLIECFRALMPLSDEQANRCVGIYHRVFAERNRQGAVPIFPGVVEAIKKWHQKGAIITIASSRGHNSLQDFVHEMELEAYVSLILGSEDVEIAKPDPCPVLKTLSHFNVSPNDALVIGDMHFDILMGRRAGCHTCGVTYGNGTAKELTDAGAEKLVDSLLEI